MFSSFVSFCYLPLYLVISSCLSSCHIPLYSVISSCLSSSLSSCLHEDMKFMYFSLFHYSYVFIFLAILSSLPVIFPWHIFSTSTIIHPHQMSKSLELLFPYFFSVCSIFNSCLITSFLILSLLVIRRSFYLPVFYSWSFFWALICVRIKRKIALYKFILSFSVSFLETPSSLLYLLYRLFLLLLFH